MLITELQAAAGFERVLRAEEPAAGYRAIVAIHNSRLGPAVGGTRRWRYATDDAALDDVLRLARGMSYKNAMAGLPMGGGKSVILADGEPASRAAVFEAHGRFVESLGGRYITAEDVGTSHEDMAIVRRETRWVAGLTDPSPVTARGVVRAMTAAVRHRWGSDDLSGRTVALQGCGNVGKSLAAQLAQAGARLLVCDVDPARAERCASQCGANVVSADTIFDQAADIYAPCALGGTLNADTIPRLRVSIVAGAANNQLALAADAGRLLARDIVYVPDYVANAGGVIDGARDICGWSDERSHAAVEALYDTTLDLLRSADDAGETPAAAADRIAEARLAA